jgi:hypothetical protein
MIVTTLADILFDDLSKETGFIRRHTLRCRSNIAKVEERLDR